MAPTRHPSDAAISPDSGSPADGAHAGSSRGSRSRLVGDALAAYALSRIAVFTAAWLYTVLRPGFSIVDILTSWDGAYYVDLVRSGYPETIPVGADGTVTTSVLGFFGGYPWLARAVGLIIPEGPAAAALVTATITGASATVAVAWLCDDLWGQTAGRRMAWLFATFPGAIVLSMAYAEGLMITAAAVCLILLHRRMWTFAGLACLVAAISRPTGTAVIVACLAAAIMAIRSDRNYRAMMAPVLGACGLVGFHALLWFRTGQAAWFRVEAEGWNQTTDWGLSSVRDHLAALVGQGEQIAPRYILGVGALLAVAGCGWLLVATLRPLASGGHTTPGPSSTAMVPVTVYTCAVVGITALSGLGLRPRFLLTSFGVLALFAVALRGRWVGLVAVVFAGLSGTFLVYTMLSWRNGLGAASLTL